MSPVVQSAPPNLLERLARRRLVVVTGKGGVGKTTLATALALLLAESGKRVLLLEVDPRESVHHLLGVSPSGGQRLRVRTGLFVQNLRPRDMLDRVVQEQLRLEFLSRRVLASPVYRHFAEGAPGLKEMAILGHAYRAVIDGAASGEGIEIVLLDAPASGHGLTLLTAPILVSEVIREGPLGRMGRDLAGLVADSERCGVVVATHAEEMPVQEAIELIAALDRRLARSPELVLVNGLYPRPDAATGRGGREDGLALWRQRSRINERELCRLSEAWPGPRVDLPLLPVDRGPRLAAALQSRLAEALTRPLEPTWS